jgi:hypothetical protein
MQETLAHLETIRDFGLTTEERSSAAAGIYGIGIGIGTNTGMPAANMEQSCDVNYLMTLPGRIWSDISPIQQHRNKSS